MKDKELKNRETKCIFSSKPLVIHIIFYVFDNIFFNKKTVNCQK
jgi:hypothetical protein